MSEYTPRISVICPCYNHAPYIRQALDSILMQEVDFPIEILVGEDCSPDNSRTVLQAYEAEHPGVFQMLYREKNMGGTSNFYDLITRASGTYIITLETDDYWTDPHKLQKQADFLDAHPEYIGCAHACEVVDEAGVPLKPQPPFPDGGQRYTLADFLREGFTFQTATLLYRNIYQDGGDYSIIRTAHPLVGDLTIFSLLLLRGDIFLSPDCMSAYRRVIKKGGTSAASQAAAHQADSLLATMRQLVALEGYFQGRIDYSSRKLYPVERYLTGLLRREPGFARAGMTYLWQNAGPTVRREAAVYLLGYPVRKIKKCLQRSSQKERPHVQ